MVKSFELTKSDNGFASSLQTLRSKEKKNVRRAIVLVDVAEDVRTAALQHDFEIERSTGRRVRAVETARSHIVPMNVNRWFRDVDKTSFQWINETCRRFVRATDAFRSAFANRREEKHSSPTNRNAAHLMKEPGTVMRCSVMARNKRETMS